MQPQSRRHTESAPPQSHRSPSTSPLSTHALGPAYADTSTKAWTPSEYFYRVRDYSNKTAKDTLFVGSNFRALTTFLSYATLLRGGAQASTNATKSATPSDEREFALIYLLKDLSDSPKPEPLCRPLPDLLRPTNNGDMQGVLMFLMGYPSPDWILQLGSAYHIDPEFFRLHLDFTQGDGVRCYGKPRLPSYRKSVFQLHVTSMGRHNSPIHGDIQQRRVESEELLQNYLRGMRNSVGWKKGDSIVRAYAAHDEYAYSIQQAVTVCLCRPRKQKSEKASGDWLCIIWMDSGRDLSASPPGPWRSNSPRRQSHFLPTVLYRPGISLLEKRLDSSVPQPTTDPATMNQSISLLPFAYGKTMNPTAMCLDPFYALNELFTFTAQSENEFLNFLETLLERSTVEHAHRATLSLIETQTELLYHRRLLAKHLEQIRDTTSFIKSRFDLDWPKYREGQASTATRWLERDFDHLLQRATRLQQQYEREMDMLMTRASLEESKASVSQAGRVTRLTILATFFIPLSFTTSFFGMNFISFPGFKDGVWVWLIFTVPLFIISVTVVSWRQGQFKQLFDQVVRNRKNVKVLM